MPEGDTVWLVARRLGEALRGSTLIEADLRVPAWATTKLTDARVVAVVPHGKHLFIRLDDPRSGRVSLHSHLRMEGAWHLYAPGQRWRGPAHQVRVVLRTDDRVAVGFRLAEVAVIPTDEESGIVGHLGPDLANPSADLTRAAANLAAAGPRPLAEALLDQRLMAGLGMNYVAEVCFLLGVHPLTPVAELPADEVVALATRMLRTNLGRASRVTAPGRTGGGGSSWVHGRRSCRRCGSELRRAVVGRAPQDRRIVWCPTCQRRIEESGTSIPARE